MGNLKAFQIKIDNKAFDYRLGKQLNLNRINSFFGKNYSVKSLWSGGRHILGLLVKYNQTLFLKLSTTAGISELTKNEYCWNAQFNKLVSRKISNYWVPKNIDFGIYNNLFYLITDHFEGKLFVKNPNQLKIPPILRENIEGIIEFSELIQSLNLPHLFIEDNPDFRNSFSKKVDSWYKSIPASLKKEYKINILLELVKTGVSKLQRKPRHGDFTPWHIFKLNSGQLELIDGEHAKKNGVEYYDIGYFIQRVFSELKNQQLAEKILSLLLKNNYNLEKLQIILSSRAIGGFLDESLKPKPDYENSDKFKNWVLSLN